MWRGKTLSLRLYKVYVMHKHLCVFVLNLAFVGYAQAIDEKTITCHGEEHEIT
jgi:hypothetical protein